MRILYASCAGAWLHRSAAELARRGETVWLYTASRNSTALSPEQYHRCWPFHAACKPFYHLFHGRYGEPAYHALFPLWQRWMSSQRLPECDVVHAVMASAEEAFDHADRVGALKVLDASNSHPTSFYGFWQRELDIWNPGARVAVPRRVFARANREIERADLVLCPSTYVRDSMLYNAIPESRLAVNPYGADLGVFTPRPAVPERPRFLFVGMLTLRKGVQYLVPAFERLQREVPEAELLLCGPVHADFRPLFRRWSARFQHVPGLPHRELAALMRTCTAFVFPSIEEGFARVIAEAMASGLPVIATHQSGASTVVEDGREGRIIRERSPDAVLEAMREMVRDRECCAVRGRAAAARIAAGGSWGHYADRLLSIYRERRTGSSTAAA
ncbi:MAG: glycosyltransferase family 4 protein [Verrucomicrobiota bacterium]